jgi:hypothetical protein
MSDAFETLLAVSLMCEEELDEGISDQFGSFFTPTMTICG